MHSKKIEDIVILTDLDGTFLDDDSRPALANIPAVQKWMENGGNISFISGRTPIEITEMIPEYTSLLNSPAIVLNGTSLFDFGNFKTIDDTLFDASPYIDYIRGVQKRYPNMYLTIITDGFEMQCNLPVDDIESKLWYQLAYLGDRDGIDKEIDEVRRVFGNNMMIEYEHHRCIRVFSKYASKGNGIRRLREYYRRMGREVTIYAVGDHGNDLSAVDSADVFACPSNAIESVKKLSKHVLCSNNEGCIANLIDLIMQDKI